MFAVDMFWLFVQNKFYNKFGSELKGSTFALPIKIGCLEKEVKEKKI
jgi:hypothetical protein